MPIAVGHKFITGVPGAIDYDLLPEDQIKSTKSKTIREWTLRYQNRMRNNGTLSYSN